MPNPIKFKLQYALLTYAQCGDLDPWSVVDHLAGLRAECIIGRENHEDGGIHLHAFVDFGGKTFRSRRADVFDVGGRHPNVQHVGKTPWLVYDYAIKEGDVVAGGAERPVEHQRSISRSDDVWAEIMGATTADEFFKLCTRLAPRSLCVSFNSLQAFAAWKYRVDPAPYQHPDGLRFKEDAVAELDAWAQANIGGTRRGTCFFFGVRRAARPSGGPVLPSRTFALNPHSKRRKGSEAIFSWTRRPRGPNTPSLPASRFRGVPPPSV